jgi:hypothetical protein
MERLMHLGAEELARRFLINERVRKHWRIIAVKAAAGKVDIEYIKGVCFRELLGAVPEEAELDAELSQLVNEVEASETGAVDILEMFGKEPREINLG